MSAPEQPDVWARLKDLEASWETRLRNQKQVIDNLSDARQALLAANAKYESFVRYVADDFTGDYALSQRARELLNTMEE